MNSKPSSTPPWIIFFIAALAVVALGSIYACRVQLRDVSYRPTVVTNEYLKITNTVRVLAKREGNKDLDNSSVGPSSPLVAAVISEPEMMATNISIMKGAIRIPLDDALPMNLGESINFMALKVYEQGFLDGMQIMDNRIRKNHFTNGMSEMFYVFKKNETFQKLQESK